jgi:small-conductance mechanosensitive channel
VLAPVPPWLVLAGLVGVINAAACFVLVGRHVSHLGWYVVLGALAAGLGQVFGDALQAPEPVKIGELNLLAASLGAWVVVLVARLALGTTQRALSRTRAHANARLLVNRIVEFTFILVAAVWVLAIFGVQLTAFVAFLGIAGLAVSLALQDLLRNLVAGLYILVERPFALGEHIDFKGASGVVETIELRTTALRSFAGQRIVIPNAMLFADMLVNRSVYGRQPVRLRVAVPLAPDERADTGPRLATTLLEAAGAVEGIHGSPAPVVVVETLGAERVALRLEAWATDARAVSPALAWLVRERVPHADITVMDEAAKPAGT